MHQFLMDGQGLPEMGRSGPGIGRHAQDAGVLALADPPDVKIGDRRLERAGLDRLVDLGHDRRIHLGVEQYLARGAQQAIGPDGDQAGADDAMAGSSQAAPQSLPPNKAMMASTEVAASATTCK